MRINYDGFLNISFIPRNTRNDTRNDDDNDNDSYDYIIIMLRTVIVIIFSEIRLELISFLLRKCWFFSPSSLVLSCLKNGKQSTAQHNVSYPS